MEDEEESVDIGLVNANDNSLFSSHPAVPLGRLETIQARRLPSSLTSPSSPDLLKRQLRLKLVNEDSPEFTPLLTRSRTLPRVHPKSPIRESAQAILSLNSVGDVPFLDAEVVMKVRRWILCVVLVMFDLDVGPVIGSIFPPFPLATAERENICFSSFPDSSQLEVGSEVHSFRIRESYKGDDVEAVRNTSEYTQDGFLYGFSWFSRRKDRAYTRGYDQRSVVVLTAHPWPSMYTKLVKCLGPMCLSHGGPMLESACHNIANWPDPSPGQTFELGILGSVLNVELPANADQQQTTETTSFHEKFDPHLHILASMAPSFPSPIRLFAASLSHMWSLWECLVLGEPLIIFGQSPAMTSQAIWWLLDVLRPIPFAGDFRPYFTIHDKDHLSLVNKNRPKSGLILGVTNPFFASTCKHWPHRLSLGEPEQSRTAAAKSSAAVISGPQPGWLTKTHNRYIAKDRDLLSRLELAVQQVKHPGLDVDGQLSLLLRRHFSSRSLAFLAPLNRYLNSLIPTPVQSHIASTQGYKNSLKPFSRDNFVASLKKHGSPLPFRSAAKQREFYERWLRSPSFGLWMAKQEEMVNALLNR